MIIRTVFQPTEELEVTEAEAEVLRLQGFLYEPPRPLPESVPQPAPSTLLGGPGPEVADAPPGAAVAKPAAAKPDPPAADSAPADQAPTTEKG